MCCVMREYVIIQRKVKVPVQDAQAGRVNSSPPPLCWRSCGGGRRLASHVLPGDFERGRGDLWQVNLAGHTRGWIWHVSMARHFGGSVWHIYLAGFHKQGKDMLLSKKRQEKRIMYISESVDCIMSLYSQ